MTRTCVLMILILMVIGLGSLYGQAIYGYDFGTLEDIHTTDGSANTGFFPGAPAGGGTYGVYMSNSGGGGFYRENPGLQNFGAGTELRIAAPTSSGAGGVNKFSVSDYNRAKNAYFKIQMRFGNRTGGFADSGTFYFFHGDGDSFTGNSPYVLNQVFLGMRFELLPNGKVRTSYVNASNAWIPFEVQPFEQGRNYLLELRLNNGPGASSQDYSINGVPQVVTNYNTDIFVNGVRVYDDLPFAGNSNTWLDSWMFYGENSGGHEANLFLDGTTYTNDVEYVAYPNYYSKPIGSLTNVSLNLLGTWGGATNGTGTAPTSFATAGQGFYIHNNPNPTIDADWTVSGGGTLVSLGNGVLPTTFTIPSNFSYNGSIDVLRNATLNIQNTSVYPTFGVLYPGSTVRFSAAGNQNIPGFNYHTLSIQGGGIKTMLSHVDADSMLVIGSSSTPVTLLVPDGTDIRGPVDMLALATLDLKNTTHTELRNLAAGSRVRYSSNGNQDVYPATYHFLDAIGSGVKLLTGNVSAHLTTVGDGETEVTLRVPAGYSLNGTVDVRNLGILDIMGSTAPTLGVLEPGSTVRYSFTGDQDVSGNTYYSMDVDNGSTKTMQGNVNVKNLDIINGYLALNGNTLHLIDKDIYFFSSNAVFSALNVEKYEEAGFPLSLPRRWTTSGAFTNTLTLTMRYPESLSTSTQMEVWYRDLPGEWTKLGSFPATLLDGYRYVSVPNLDLISTAGKGSFEWTLGEVDDTLPVELSSFTAVVGLQNKVNVLWTTQSETNVLGFQIYRSQDASLAEALLISNLITATNSSTEQSYFFKDETVWEAGTYYYWLQNLDLDGSNQYHGPVVLNLEPISGGSFTPLYKTGFERVYPNPFNPITNIEFGLSSATQVSLELYNLRGQLVTRMLDAYKDKGLHSLRFDAKDSSGRELPSGIYQLVMRAGSESFRQKLVLLK